MSQPKELHTIYQTDDIEQARSVAFSNENVSVMYHDPNLKVSPILTLKDNGKTYTKWNPDYVEYLRRKHPDISDEEIRNCMELAIAQLELQEAEKEKEYDSSVPKR